MASVLTQLRISASSVDVIHALALPGIGLKLDAIPSRVSEQTFAFYVVGLSRSMF